MDDWGSILPYLFGTLFLWLIYVAIIAFFIVCLWKVFIKAGKPGWAALIPFYNFVVLFEISELPWWLIFIMIFVPGAAFVLFIIVDFKLAAVFGRSVGFGFGLLFLHIIFIAILAFGKDKYIGHPLEY